MNWRIAQPARRFAAPLATAAVAAKTPIAAWALGPGTASAAAACNVSQVGRTAVDSRAGKTVTASLLTNCRGQKAAYVTSSFTDPDSETVGFVYTNSTPGGEYCDMRWTGSKFACETPFTSPVRDCYAEAEADAGLKYGYRHADVTRDAEGCGLEYYP